VGQVETTNLGRRKSSEYYSRHYGKVYKDPDTPLTVLEAIVGINQLLEEEAGGEKEAPPHNAEPFTRLLLRLFDGIQALPRDQMYKFLRGTGSAPSDYTARGWTSEKNKIFRQTPPLEIARNWAGKLRKGMTSDYDQAMFLIGACIEGSGINANETLNNAASRAQQLYQIWESKNQKKVSQLSLFESLGEEGA
jgi:putative DNA methylase